MTLSIVTVSLVPLVDTWKPYDKPIGGGDVNPKNSPYSAFFFWSPYVGLVEESLCLYQVPVQTENCGTPKEQHAELKRTLW